MSITLSALQRQRRDTAANWTAENPTLLAGEIGLEADTGYWKVGNGSSAWNSLAYVPGLGAELPVNRLADGTARQLLQTAANGTDVEWASNIDVPGTLDVTGAATFDSNVTVQGDLTVNGSTTTIDTTTLLVEDKNIEIGKVATPTDLTADGGGITLKGTTDKTIAWLDATDAWTLSEHVNIANGKEYRINGTKVLDATSLGSGLLTDSTNSTSTTTAATPNSVKAAYDLANAALPKAGGALTGDVTLNAQSDLRFADADSSNWVAFQAPATVTTNVTWTLPAADGTASQVLSTNGTGTLSWTTPASGAGLDTAQTWTKGQRGEITALTDGATITPDFADSNNFSVTLGGSRTLANPTNLVAGQSGCIWITQDGTGSRTLAYGSQWDFTGGTAPTLTTTAAARDCLVYSVQSTTQITATLITNLS